MKVIKVLDNKKVEIKYQTTRQLEEKLSTRKSELSGECLKEVKFVIKNDDEDQMLKLLVILSPIFLATFDSSKEELGFFKEKLDDSNFPYGLYPEFFPFSENDYRSFYENIENKEDIYLNKDREIEFSLNPLLDKYILALAYLIEHLIVDDKNRNALLAYFDEIRNDIVINGRRSILANGIQAFYLSKYVLVWMIDFCENLMEEKEGELFLDPIYERINSLKRADY
ncbi:hypothetical protein [Anaerococcus tetradius]|uniref:hypothetical protein n=1 Tax=Anaerococcus tetradius TaxID=33036 RepID=UPI0023F36B3C|nr:hypothetical protein [Anaerococcus tetradius]